MNGWTRRCLAAGRLASVALCLLVGVLAQVAWLGGVPSAHAAAYRVYGAETARADTEDRPEQQVAYARIAVVRVLTYYAGSGTDSVPIPVLNPCASDGVLVGTTGDGLNSYNYVLTPTAAVNPISPCQGVQAAFQQLNGRAHSWSITRIQVLLNAAYTGTDDKQLGSITYTIDPAQITTNGGPTAPKLLTLPLGPSKGAPSHDLPVLTIPQASDVPATDPGTIIDLVGHDGDLLGRDSVDADEVATTLYPVTVAATEIPAATATATATATPATAPGTGGTVNQPSATATPAQAQDTPTATGADVNIGAPVVNANGRLVGMVINNSNGTHVLASQADIKKAIGPVSGKSGPLMSGWQKGIQAFYQDPPNYATAASAFSGLAAQDADFGGVAAFETAAKQHQTTIPSLVETDNGQTPTLQPQTLGNELNTVAIVAAVGVVLVLLGLGALGLVVVLRRRAQRALAFQTQRPADEAMLDLLPPDSPLAKPLPDIPPEQLLPRPVDLTQVETLQIPAVTAAPAPPRPRPMTQPRVGTSLMPYAAGVVDPGIKRAREPNQDNILALHGVRLAGARPQPYGLFIVADGMGGHLNGQEASLLTIQIVTQTVLHALNTTQVYDADALVALLREAIQRADGELRQRNATTHGDMGTTITAALVVEDRAYVVNVGDSRTYYMSPDSGLSRVTTDHSVVQTLVENGVIRPEEVYTHPRRNQIYRSLGGEDAPVEVDAFQVPLQAGDKLLLCSDGLWEMVRDPQIALILRSTADPQQAAQLLVREANTNGGEDNIGVVVVRLLDLPQNAQPGMQVLAAPQEPQRPQGVSGTQGPQGTQGSQGAQGTQGSQPVAY